MNKAERTARITDLETELAETQEDLNVALLENNKLTAQLEALEQQVAAMEDFFGPLE